MSTFDNSTSSETSISDAAKQYERDGFCIANPVLSTDLIERTVDRMDAVIRGEYETGKPPLPSWKSGDSPTKLRKIDQAHISDRTIFEAVTSPELGRITAAITGAKMIQVWAVQLLYKPPGGDAKGSVGWHQDYFYWQSWWKPESNVFTAWLALSEVKEESGPMHFAAGSHRWGLLGAGDFFGVADENQRAQIPVPSGEVWLERSGAMPIGAFSLHHRLTFHGSQPNISNIPRYSFAIHLRTEKSTPTPILKKGNVADHATYDYVSYLDDPSICPIIHQE